MKRVIRANDDNINNVKVPAGLDKYFDVISDEHYEEITGDKLDGYPCEELEGYDAKHIGWAQCKPNYLDAFLDDGLDILEIVQEGDGEPFLGYSVNDRLYPLYLNEAEKIVGRETEIGSLTSLEPSKGVTSGCSFDFTWEDDYDAQEIESAVNSAFDSCGLTVIAVDFYSVDYSQYPEYDDVNVSQCGVDFEWEDDYDPESIRSAVETEMASIGYPVVGLDFYTI